MTEKATQWLESLREYEAKVAAARKISFDFTPLQNAQFEIAESAVRSQFVILEGA